FQIHIAGAYPLFAAVAAPNAPPTLARPIGLGRGTSVGETSLRASVLTATLVPVLRAHAPKVTGSLDQEIGALARWAHSSFQEWKGQTQLVGVMGTGKVLNFAPPYVPVGSVAMGENFSVGPVFAGPRFGKVEFTAPIQR